MDVISRNKRICQLIAKQLWERLSDDEKQELQEWIQISPENKSLYDELVRRERVKQYVEKRESIDVRKYMAIYERELGIKSKRRVINRYWGYAAAILILCVVGVCVWMNKQEEVRIGEIAQTVIGPGKAKALLVLDDGREIELGNQESSKDLEASGIVVISDSSRVKYSQEEGAEEKEVMNKIIVPTGGEYNLILSDGTWVYLNAESVITFPKKFVGERREVILEGEAYFHVTASKEHPFIVKTRDMDVLVTGTEFNVKAYPDESNVQTTLLQGKVAVFAGEDKKEKVEIRPNQQAEWDRGGVKLQVREVDPDLFVAWKNGHFIFRQDRLEDIMRTLARWYDMEVIYLDTSIKDMAFAGKLDSLFTVSSELEGETVSADISGLIGQYAHGNEPSHHVIYLFNAVGQQNLTQKYVAKVMNELYKNEPAGLCGNEDCGQMSAWYVFSAMGFYPVNPVSGKYEIGTPLFPEMQLHLANGKTFTVLAPNVNKKNIYIQSIKVNGQPYDKTYLTHEQIMSGATVEFEMGAAPKAIGVIFEEKNP